MTPPPVAPGERRLARAVGRGLRGKCPRCGEGRLLSGYISPRAACEACGEDLSPYQTADFAPYLTTFAIGLTFTPMIVLVEMSAHPSQALMGALGAVALGCALALLPVAKGAAIALLWSLDIQVNQ
jgi:uncharacterized protein (DUF983 family)